MAGSAKVDGEGRASDGSATPSLFAKIAQVMGEVGFVEKRGRNDFHKYDYATEADVLSAVREKLAARNVALVPSLRSIDERAYETRQGKGSIVTTARIAYTFLDGDSGETYTAEWGGQGDDPADKGLYKAMTGSEKYFLMKTFLIPTGDDPEADRAADERAQGRQAAPAPKPEPLNDPRAKQLLSDARTRYQAIIARDPGKVALKDFERWVAHASTSHDELERLVNHLSGILKEVESK